MNLFALSIYLITSVFSVSALAQMSQAELDRFLLNASRSGDIQSVRAAIDAGADVNVRDENNCTSLMYAVSYDFCDSSSNNYHRSIVDILIDTGVLNKMSPHYYHLNAFLLRASEFGDTENVIAAIDVGADANIFLSLRSDFKPALFRASENGHADVVRILIIDGAYSINRRVVLEGRSWTALDIARENNHEDVLRVLKDAGA